MEKTDDETILGQDKNYGDDMENVKYSFKTKLERNKYLKTLTTRNHQQHYAQNSG